MSITLYSVPILNQSPLIHSNKFSTAYPPRLLSASSSSSTRSVVAADDDDQSQESQHIPLRGCKSCRREEIERGCNGEGRIQGGIATVPGFGWWPIKAYRPCPGFLASGGRYRRQGQSIDEVAFGRVDETRD